MNLMMRRRAMMAGLKMLKTVTGAIATFVTNWKLPLHSVTIPFTPIQAGEGDPSPTNVREISGWTGCEISHRGKNLFDKNNFKTLRGVSNNLVFESSTAWGLEFPCLPNTTYTFTRQTTACNRFNAYDCADSAIVEGSQFLHTSGNVSGTKLTFTTKPTAKTIFLYLNTEGTSSTTRTNFNNTVAGLQIEFGDASTSYAKYQGEAVPITFTDPSTGDPMTVYGGTLTLNEDGSADLVPNCALISPLTYTKRTFSDYRCARYTFNTSKYSWAGRCNMFRMVTSNADHAPYTFWTPSSGILYFQFSVTATDEEIDAAMSNLQFVQNYHPNYTPTPIHIADAGQLTAFKGINNVWSDLNGDVTVQYWK